MDGYLAKPIRAQELYQMIEGSVPLQHFTSPAESTAPTARCDWSAGLRRVGGDEGLLREIAGLMLDECPRLMTELHKHLAAGDVPRVRIAAHTLKGSLDNIGAAAARDLAEQVEEQARQGALHETAAVCQQLEKELDRLRPELAAVADGRLPFAVSA
jgi:HPt (histidine-containing phosphotransfer) domain-containing protein